MDWQSLRDAPETALEWLLPTRFPWTTLYLPASSRSPAWWLLALAALLWSAAAQATNTSDPIPIIVTEYSSTVWVRSGDWSDIRSMVGLAAWDCFAIRIFPTGAVNQLRVTSSGLGPVRFGRGVCGAADEAPGETSLELGPLPASGSRVAVYMDAAHPARAGVPLAGELVFLAEGFKPERVKIELKQQPVSTFWQAFTWTFGIGIPALLTFSLGLWAQRIKGKRDAEDQFFHFRFSKNEELTEFFSNYYQTFLEKDDFPQKTYEKLVDRSLFEPIPPHYAKPILESLYKNDKSAFEKALTNAFPEFLRTRRCDG